MQVMQFEFGPVVVTEFVKVKIVVEAVQSKHTSEFYNVAPS